MLLNIKAVAIDTVNAEAYVYDLGTSGTSAPKFVYSFTNVPVVTDNLTTPGTYMYPNLNGSADGGVVYLDNYNVTGYRSTVEVEQVLLNPNDIKMPTIAINELPIRSDLKMDVRYVIYNTEGKKIKEGTFNNSTNINVSTLTPSNYFIRFISQNNTLTRRFIKK